MAEKDKEERSDEPKSSKDGEGGGAKAEETDEKTAEKEDSSAEDESKAEESKAEESKAEDAPEDDNAAAQRVAEALGVDGEGEQAVDEAKEPEAAPNRAARRREEALKRRKKKAPSAETAPAPEDDDELPKDRNKRAKELLARRREQAASGGSRPINLLPGEMVDDALARSASAASKWIRTNFSKIQWVIVAGVIGGGAFLVYRTQIDKKVAVSSDALAVAIAADRGRVMAEDKRSDEEKEYDPTKIFKTPEERNDTAAAAYKKVVEEHPSSGPAILAKLGEAGVMYDKKDYARALELFSSVAASTLAGADADVKGRALEGLALTKEGKGDIDGALATFKEMESTLEAKGFKELAMYHQGRLLLAKGQTDAAKDILKKVREKLQAPSADGHPYPHLEQMVDEYLRKIDPALVPARTQLGGAKGNAISPEELEKLMKRASEAAEKKGGPGQPGHGDGH